MNQYGKHITLTNEIDCCQKLCKEFIQWFEIVFDKDWGNTVKMLNISMNESERFESSISGQHTFVSVGAISDGYNHESLLDTYHCFKGEGLPRAERKAETIILLNRFECVFDSDWEYAKCNLNILENVGGFIIADDQTFINHRQDQAGIVWESKDVLLRKYHALKDCMHQ